MLLNPPERLGDSSVERAYDYRNENGKLLFYKLRLKQPDGGKDFRYFNPRHPTYEGAYHKPKTKGVDALLYRMPQIWKAIGTGSDIWWCAGEKDAERVQRELSGRACATTMHGGEGKPLKHGQADWFGSFNGILHIIGDRDASGYRDMLHKNDALLDAGMDMSRVHFWLPRVAGEGADAYDHLEAKLGLGDLVPQKIDQLRKKVGEAKDKAQQDKADRKNQTKGQERLQRWHDALRAIGSEPNGKEDWNCPHPEHEDDRQSFGVSVGETGDIVLKCQGCESVGRDEDRRDWIDEILDALGLAWSDIRDTVADLEIPGNDTEAAEWLLERHGDDMRWLDVGTAAKSRWIVWEGSRWNMDGDGLVRRWMGELAKEVIPKAKDHAKRMRGIRGQMGPANDLLKAAKALGNKSRMEAALSVAQTLRPGMTIQRGVFDADKNALAVGNGILLLEEHKARLVESTRERFMLRNTGVPYVSDATSTAWDAFLEKFVADDEMEDFLARMAGYTLLGSNDDNFMFIFQGETGSGKTTFTKAISKALGDYAKPFDLGALRGKMSADAPREDIAAIMHARLAHAAEMTGAFVLHADQVKRMSGADEIPYRHLFEGMTSHIPDFTAWISSNFSPRIKGSDRALQKRLVGVPFLHPLPAGEEKSSKHKALETLEARTAIMAWMVAGYGRYREVGLSTGTWPKPVAEVTARLRASLDVEDDFRADMYDEDATSYALAGDHMYDLYTAWCFKHGVREPMSSQQFGEAMTQKGYPRKRKRIEGHPTWVRVGLKPKSDVQVKSSAR